MRQHFTLLVIGCLLVILIMAPLLVVGQDQGVTAEAINQANLRSDPDVNSDQVGEIRAGTRYLVLGRSEYYPWLLLGDPATGQPIGWVFRDLVNVHGDITQVPISTRTISLDAIEAPAEEVPEETDELPGPPPADATPSATATATIEAEVTGISRGQINIRYGPGVDYPIIGRAQNGDPFSVTGYHTQFPWVQVRFEESPNGYAWIANDLLDYQGDRFSLPAISATTFELPQLTPTPSILEVSSLPGMDIAEIRPEIAALADDIWNQVLEADFIPESPRFGALYFQDLLTGEAIAFGNDIAFSGTSITKVAILIEYFRSRSDTPNILESVDIANTMICSENVATNRLLNYIGQGDELRGAEQTTQLLRDLGLQKTFLTAPFQIPTRNTPTPPPRAYEFPETAADQQRANPNPTNQMTVEEMGWLLGMVYQCAYHESGPLLEDIDGNLTPQECRKILYIMTNNTHDGMLKAGVPEGIEVAHKHGWVEDTHGNAAVLFTPNRDYVMVMMLHQPFWLNFMESLPVIAEASRTVYNYYNPDQPLDEVREGFFPEDCNYNVESPLVGEIASPSFLQTLDTSLFYSPLEDGSDLQDSAEVETLDDAAITDESP
jgi:uncharacterized protein YraI/beta-lactamase class A